MNPRSARPLALAVAAAALLAGCTSAHADAPPTTTSPTPTTPTTPTTTTIETVTIPTVPGAVEMTDGHYYLLVGGKRVVVPTEKGTRPIDQTVDAGQQILITTRGFWPQQLFATPGLPVTFTNLTDVPQEVVFDYSSVRSGVIAPAGGTWSWTSKTLVSYRYHGAAGTSGVLIVNPQVP